MSRSLVRTFKTAVRALRRNIMRSALTCLGIIIGIGAVIAMVEIGQGSSHVIAQTIASMGANQVGISPDSSQQGGVSSGAATGLTLTPEDCEAILRECPAVRYAAPSVDGRSQIIYGNRNWSPSSFKGTTPAYLHVKNWDALKEGECFTDDDVRRSAAVCLIGQTIERELFGGQSAVGKEVRVKNLDMKIVGVLGKKGANMTGRDQDDVIIAPWTTIKYRISGTKLSLQAAASSVTSSVNSINDLYPTQKASLYPLPSAAQLANRPMVVRFHDLDDIYCSIRTPEEVPIAMQQITQVLRERHRIKEGDPDDFEVRNITEIMTTFSNSTRLLANLLMCIAMISLVVGGVGIMNIMLVSVTERTREIGLRMAVGARGRDILRQFLIEAVVLCFFGGVVGILVGRGTSIAITAILRWPTLASMPAIIAAVATSVVVGVVFGFYPAWKASRLDPIEALRFE